MSILLDTSACIAVMNGQPPIVARRLAQSLEQGTDVAVPSIALFELWHGVAKSACVERNVATLQIFLTPLTILYFDADDARLAGEMKASLEREAISLGSYDILIAAQALRHGLTLITADSDFARAPDLRWENWAA